MKCLDLLITFPLLHDIESKVLSCLTQMVHNLIDVSLLISLSFTAVLLDHLDWCHFGVSCIYKSPKRFEFVTYNEGSFDQVLPRQAPTSLSDSRLPISGSQSHCLDSSSANQRCCGLVQSAFDTPPTLIAVTGSALRAASPSISAIGELTVAISHSSLK